MPSCQKFITIVALLKRMQGALQRQCSLGKYTTRNKHRRSHPLTNSCLLPMRPFCANPSYLFRAPRHPRCAGVVYVFSINILRVADEARAVFPSSVALFKAKDLDFYDVGRRRVSCILTKSDSRLRFES